MANGRCPTTERSVRIRFYESFSFRIGPNDLPNGWNSGRPIPVPVVEQKSDSARTISLQRWAFVQRLQTDCRLPAMTANARSIPIASSRATQECGRPFRKCLCELTMSTCVHRCSGLLLCRARARALAPVSMGLRVRVFNRNET